jgi:hypothetical protein
MHPVNSYKANYRNSAVWILLIALQTDKSIEITTTGPV